MLYLTFYALLAAGLALGIYGIFDAIKGEE